MTEEHNRNLFDHYIILRITFRLRPFLDHKKTTSLEILSLHYQEWATLVHLLSWNYVDARMCDLFGEMAPNLSEFDKGRVMDMLETR